MKLTISKFNTWTFYALFGAAFILILFKMLYVPITHDEVATTTLSQDSSFWELITYKDPIPNNHILNSVLTKIVTGIFGVQQWSIRIPNLLFFIVFALGVWRISKTVFSVNSSFFIPAALIFITNPYLLDFFSLCRGYGMSAALCTLSLSYTISAFSHKKVKHIWIALVLSCLASYANFSLLYFWLASAIMTALFIFIYRKTLTKSLFRNALMLILISSLFGLLISFPIYRMSSTDQFRFWNSNGFYQDTIYSLVSNSLYGSKALFFQLYEFMAIFSVVLICFNACYILLRSKSSDERRKLISHPIFTSSMIFLLTAGINYAHASILNTPYLTGRTSLFYYPLFIAAMLSSISLLSQLKWAKIKIGISIATFTICSIQLVHSWSPYVIREWFYDANNLNVINYLDQQRDGKEVTIRTNWLFTPSFYFYQHFEDLEWMKLESYDKSINPNTNSKYYYAMYYDEKALEKNFKVLFKYDSGGILFVKR